MKVEFLICIVKINAPDKSARRFVKGFLVCSIFILAMAAGPFYIPKRCYERRDRGELNKADASSLFFDLKSITRSRRPRRFTPIKDSSVLRVYTAHEHVRGDWR